MKTLKDKLIESYSNQSKHSNYQILPASLQRIIGQEEVATETRYEKERLEYLLKHLDFSNKSVLDIGGNTGYFTFELLDVGASHITHYEGNKEHSEFVRLAAEATKKKDFVSAINDYFSFDGSYEKFHDIILLFNVLHHVGDDYGDKNLTIDEAKKEIARQLNSLREHCSEIVFQLGFNWRGDTSMPLFGNGTKREMIDFIRSEVDGVWRIESIGVAQHTGEGVVYFELNEDNIERDDSLGEFLNRPIFIMKPTK